MRIELFGLVFMTRKEEMRRTFLDMRPWFELLGKYPEGRVIIEKENLPLTWTICGNCKEFYRVLDGHQCE